MLDDWGSMLVSISGDEKTIDELYRFLAEISQPEMYEVPCESGGTEIVVRFDKMYEWPGNFAYAKTRLEAQLHLSFLPILIREETAPVAILEQTSQLSPTKLVMKVYIKSFPGDGVLKFLLIASGKWNENLCVKVGSIDVCGDAISGNDPDMMAEAAKLSTEHCCELLAVIADCCNPTIYDPTTGYNQALIHAVKSEGFEAAAVDKDAMRLKAEQGDVDAYHELAKLRHINEDDYEHWTRRAAEQGDATAQYHLAGILNYEHNCEGERWLRLAAEQGDSTAQCDLAAMYEREDSPVEQDYTKAIQWYRKAAKQDSKLAQFKLAHMYETGTGMAQNYVEAMRWYQTAATTKKNDADMECIMTETGRAIAAARYAIGHLYETGLGVEQDACEAATWYQSAATSKYVPAQNALGRMYLEGRGVAQDYSEALKLYRAAARENGSSEIRADMIGIPESGHSEAQAALAYMYERGLGVTHNRTAANYWYRRATNPIPVFDSYITRLAYEVEEEHRHFREIVEQFQNTLMSDTNRKKLNNLRQKGQKLCEQSDLAMRHCDTHNLSAASLMRMETSLQALTDTNRELKQAFTEFRAEVKANHAETMSALRELAAAADEIRGCQRRAAELLAQQNLSLEKQEQILTHLTDDITDKVSAALEQMAERDKRQAQEKFKRELQNTFGDDWSRLKPESQRFLVTAKVLFDYQQGHTVDLDYSGVCLLAVKALEGELRKRLFDGYKAYMKRKSSSKPDTQTWPSCLLYRTPYGKTKLSTDFSLGSVSVICGTREGKQLAQHEAKLLDEYAKASLLRAGMSKVERQEALEYIGRNADIIREKYRNPAAHVNALRSDEAHKCLDFLLDVERALVKMMQMFR